LNLLAPSPDIPERPIPHFWAKRPRGGTKAGAVGYRGCWQSQLRHCREATKL